MNHNQETSKEAQPGRVNLFPAIAQVDGPHLNPPGVFALLGEMVEPDGFEPTTSCLQSTRSTN